MVGYDEMLVLGGREHIRRLGQSGSAGTSGLQWCKLCSLVLEQVWGCLKPCRKTFCACMCV